MNIEATIEGLVKGKYIITREFIESIVKELPVKEGSFELAQSLYNTLRCNGYEAESVSFIDGIKVYDFESDFGAENGSYKLDIVTLDRLEDNYGIYRTHSEAVTAGLKIIHKTCTKNPLNKSIKVTKVSW